MGVGGGGASKAFCNAHMKQHISKGGFPYFAVNVQVLTSSGGIEDFINRRARRSKTGTVTWDFGDDEGDYEQEEARVAQ